MYLIVISVQSVLQKIIILFRIQILEIHMHLLLFEHFPLLLQLHPHFDLHPFKGTSASEPLGSN